MIQAPESAEYLCFRLAFRPGSWKVSGRSRMRRIAQILPTTGLALALALSIGACAGPGTPGVDTAASLSLAAAQLAALEPAAVRSPALVAQAAPAALVAQAAPVAPGGTDDGGNDPYEGFNRTMFDFNQAVDRWFLRPVAWFYRESVPGFLRDRFHDFLGNLKTPVILLNDLMQGNLPRADLTLRRFSSTPRSASAA